MPHALADAQWYARTRRAQCSLVTPLSYPSHIPDTLRRFYAVDDELCLLALVGGVDALSYADVCVFGHAGDSPVSMAALQSRYEVAADAINRRQGREIPLFVVGCGSGATSAAGEVGAGGEAASLC